jgi:hypothetical protein
MNDGETKVAKELEDAEYLLCSGGRVPQQLIENAWKLKLIQSGGQDTGHLPVKYALEKGIFVANAGGANAIAVSEYVVCAMDPAMSGDTFSVVLAGDRTTQKRYLLEASRMPAPSPDQIRELIFSWTEKYKPRVWVIEKNAFQLFLTQEDSPSSVILVAFICDYQNI